MTQLSTDLETLTKRRDALNQRIWAAEKKYRDKAALPLVGKCFRYRNSYSCPKSESERWWLYRRVLRTSPSGRLVVFEFQTDHNGRIEIEPDTKVVGHENIGEPITLRQFQHAWKILVRGINVKADAAGAVK